MGLWLTVGKAALKVGLPLLTKMARERLTAKEKKASIENNWLEDEQHSAALRRAAKRDERERAKAAR